MNKANQQIVGRAELKLAEAAKAFRYDFRGKIVLDIGSSTGGFTEYALRQGASKVVAVEKGTNQMKAPLRFDSRIILLEKTDIFDIAVAKSYATASGKTHAVMPAKSCATSEAQTILQKQTPVAEIKHAFDTILADVSFISLTKILRHTQKSLASTETDFLVMLKPQFEARPDQLVKGVVKNERMRREIIKKFELWLMQNGFVVVQKRDNETIGKVGGNREKFYWLRLAKANKR